MRALLLSPMELGLMVRWRTGRWGLGRSAMGLGVGRRNRSAIRELAGELRDEGDEGVGRRAREKKKWRKKEERREARERERK